MGQVAGHIRGARVTPFEVRLSPIAASAVNCFIRPPLDLLDPRSCQRWPGENLERDSKIVYVVKTELLDGGMVAHPHPANRANARACSGAS